MTWYQKFQWILSAGTEVFEKLKQFTSELWMTFLNSKSIRNRTKRQAAPSNHQMCSVTKGALRNFAKFTRKRLCRSLFFNKVAGPYYRTPPDDYFCPIFINLLLEQKLFQKGQLVGCHQYNLFILDSVYMLIKILNN